MDGASLHYVYSAVSRVASSIANRNFGPVSLLSVLTFITTCFLTQDGMFGYHTF